MANDDKPVVDYSKIRVGLKQLPDAIYNLSASDKARPTVTDKDMVLDAIARCDVAQMVDISNYYYRTSGIYNRLCRYMAYMYMYDWMVTPYINSESVKKEKIMGDFNKVLSYLDNSGVKKFFGETALKVLKNGRYYGYLIPLADKFMVQELPIKYCRVRFTSSYGTPAVEFNMKYFDEAFRDANQRMRILKLFPDDFKKGYLKYKEGKLVPEYPGDTAGWWLLDPKFSVCFSLNEEGYPLFISTIPALIDLEMAKTLDRKKMEQQLLKIIIQKIPVDKNGDVIFDPDEARELHLNAIAMIEDAIGVKILTTFADTEVEEIASNAGNTSDNEGLSRAKDAVFDQAGTSMQQFNTDGNLALEKSTANDEAAIYNLIQQFESFLNNAISQFNRTPKKMSFRVQILKTTIYNYKELSKLYKEQTQLGYSKFLPQIALGQSQSSILANAYFENDILDLVNVFIPPMSSNTMSSKSSVVNSSGGESGKAGRPEKPDDQKSEKTIKNKESM